MHNILRVIREFFHRDASAGYDRALNKRHQEKVLRDKGYSRNQAKKMISSRFI